MPDNCKIDEKIIVSPENTLKMLDYFQNEWLYRHKHFWDISIKLFLFNLVFTMLPFISEAFGITFRLNQFPMLTFPIFGIFLACVSYSIMMQEVSRLDKVNQAKRDIIENQMDDLYKYRLCNKTNKIAPSIPLQFLVFQLFIGIFALVVLLT